MPPQSFAPMHAGHSHVFLAPGHERSERKTWAVIWLCGAMMLLEIVGGLTFGSIAWPGKVSLRRLQGKPGPGQNLNSVAACHGAMRLAHWILAWLR